MGRCEKSGCETKCSSGREVAQQVMALAAKANGRSLFLWTHQRGRRELPSVNWPLTSTRVPRLACAGTECKEKENLCLTRTCTGAIEKEDVSAVLHVCSLQMGILG